ncbi:MAG: GNAT family N-acetyltransferase [Lachnospiraceae bacterium]
MQIWLDGNIEAHSFVSQEYGKSNFPLVMEQLLLAEVYVYEIDSLVLGFVGMQEDYLAGIFVDKAAQSMGVGKQLLDYIKETHSVFSLNVYQENSRAITFYQREGLTITAEGIEEDTGNIEYSMEWMQEQVEAMR